MRILIFSLLFSSFAYGGQVETLVCRELTDLVTVINTHVNEDEKAGYKIGYELIVARKCTVAAVNHPDDPRKVVASYSASQDNIILMAIPLQNGLHALLRYQYKSALKNEVSI